VVNQSLLLDIKILFRSAIVVFHGKGIQPGQGPRTLDDLMPTNECMDTQKRNQGKGQFLKESNSMIVVLVLRALLVHIWSTS